MSCLETFTGLYFDFTDPQPEQVCIEDVARALSNTARFGGHTSRFMSVAEHACLVARLVEDNDWSNSAALRLGALHHDSHEAYLGDLPTPLKRDLGDRYQQLRKEADRAIATVLGFTNDWPFHASAVTKADALALRIEARELKASRGVGEHWGHDKPEFRPAPWPLGWAPDVAEWRFLEAHERLAAQS